MPKVWVIVEEATPAWVTAFCQTLKDSSESVEWAIAEVSSLPKLIEDDLEALLCLLTLNLPPSLTFPGKSVFQRCGEVETLRQWVQTQTDYQVGNGQGWLPIALTAKGPLYAEVIGVKGEMSPASRSLPELAQWDYYQPLHLPDRLRQPLYRMGHCVLKELSALPGVYLLQFGFQGEDVVFDRVWPFPGPPAIASLEVQQPDLFTCHWACLTGQPILDLIIAAPKEYQIYPQSSVC